MRRVLANLRAGRMQKTLGLAAAAAAPPLTVVGVAAAFSPRVARTALPAVSALFVLDGVAGLVTHVRGIHRRPGGFRETAYNLVMGPPLLAPGALLAIGALGLLAPLMERER